MDVKLMMMMMMMMMMMILDSSVGTSYHIFYFELLTDARSRDGRGDNRFVRHGKRSKTRVGAEAVVSVCFDYCNDVMICLISVMSSTADGQCPESTRFRFLPGSCPDIVEFSFQIRELHLGTVNNVSKT